MRASTLCGFTRRDGAPALSLAIALAALLVGAQPANAICGDGIQDLGELCDDGALNGTPESCCQVDCGCRVGESCGASCFMPLACWTRESAGPEFYVCECLSEAPPCGESGPSCAGSCPTGEKCADVGPPGFFANCGCIPEASSPCGDAAFPSCGGGCPTGQECDAVTYSQAGQNFSGCGCNEPAPCGEFVCGGGWQCPGELVCNVAPQIPACFCL